MYSLSTTSKDISKALAERHKALRKHLKISQVEMTERVGVSLGSLERLEGTVKISLEPLLKLAHFTNRLGDFETVFQIIEDQSDIEKLFTTKP